MQSPPLSLYIHLPWCLHKCAYCDFNSHATEADAFPEKDYTHRLIADLVQASIQTKDRQVQSIFIGGGTPSLFSPQAIASILTACKQHTQLTENCEITLETNPGTFEADKFSEFLACGINRLSIGVQSFNDDYLEALDRIHSSHEALNAIQTAQDIGFKNINIDLMFALPEQRIEDAIADVSTACQQEVNHISYYQLTLEPNTVFYRFPPRLPSEEDSWQIQQQGMEKLNNAGFQRYEVSAFCKPDAQCVHNTNYWQYGDYLGMGAGAHSKLTLGEKITRQQRPRQPDSYIKAVNENSHVINLKTVSSDELVFEFMLHNLRLREGFTQTHFCSVTGLAFSTIEPKINRCVEEDLLMLQNDHIKATDLGYRFLDEITEKFLPDNSCS